MNVSLPRDVERGVIALARHDQVPHATKAAELIGIGLEIEEDAALAAIAESRDTNNVRWLTHEEVWGTKKKTATRPRTTPLSRTMSAGSTKRGKSGSSGR